MIVLTLTILRQLLQDLQDKVWGRLRQEEIRKAQESLGKVKERPLKSWWDFL